MKRGSMRRWLVIGSLCWLGLAGRAEAGVLDWPVINHVVKIGSCVIADAGSIAKSAAVHATGFGVDVLTIVGKCATFVLETLTPGLVPDPR